MKKAAQRAPAAPSPLPLGQILEFMRLLWAVDHGLQASSKRMQSQLGVTGPQRLVVRIVGKFPGISAKEIAHILHMHKSTVTFVTQRLEERGALTRTVDPSDRRRANVELTAKGRELDQIRGGTVEAAVRRTMNRVPETTMRGVRQLLAVLAEELARGGSTSS